MTEELDILRIVAENPDISQRKIAEQTGISLGQVNFLIKKCAKKGLIKIEGQTSKSIKYNLTPKGLSEKAARTLQYIKISYGAVIALTDRIRIMADRYRAEGYDIYIYGSQDEMMEIVKLAIDGKTKCTVITDEWLEAARSDSTGKVVFYWEPDKTSRLNGFTSVNILE